jgi:hypothetical protein
VEECVPGAAWRLAGLTGKPYASPGAGATGPFTFATQPEAILAEASGSGGESIAAAATKAIVPKPAMQPTIQR